MANELDQFNNLAEVPATVESEKKTDAAKAARLAALKAAMNATLAENKDTYLQIKGTLSSSIKVERVLGFGAGGGLIQSQKAAKIVDEKTGAVTEISRAVAPVPKNVGYKITNIGTEVITYTTETFAQDATGKFVGAVGSAEIKPGESAYISRKYMTLLGANPKFSNKFANGKLVRTSAGGKAIPGSVNLEAELEAYTFVFNPDENGVSISVNDDSVKDQIGQKTTDGNGKDKWIVKPEYTAVFGYLNNVTEKVAKVKTAGPNVDAQDMAANYIYRLASESGLM